MLSAWFITGFTDAEGCFFIGVQKSNKVKTNWEVQPEFKIELHSKDILILKKFKKFFGVGKISSKGDKAAYRVKSVKDLLTIITHFDNYPLITNKYANYMLFKSIFRLILSKEHLTNEGLLKIFRLKASLNNGLPERLKAYFPGIEPVSRPSIPSIQIKDPQWLCGFVSGEGCFLIDTYKSKTTLGVGVTLRFKIAQHSRDRDLMEYLKKYFNCGYFNNKPTDNVGEFIVAKFSDIKEKIIPFFSENTIVGVKYWDFIDFKRGAELIENKLHLTSTGLEQILLIKASMNKGRKGIC